MKLGFGSRFDLVEANLPANKLAFLHALKHIVIVMHWELFLKTPLTLHIPNYTNTSTLCSTYYVNSIGKSPGKTIQPGLQFALVIVRSRGKYRTLSFESLPPTQKIHLPRESDCKRVQMGL